MSMLRSDHGKMLFYFFCQELFIIKIPIKQLDIQFILFCCKQYKQEYVFIFLENKVSLCFYNQLRLSPDFI